MRMRLPQRNHERSLFSTVKDSKLQRFGMLASNSFWEPSGEFYLFNFWGFVRHLSDVRLTHVKTSLLAALLCLCAGLATAATSHTQARLLLDAAAARPGQTVMAGVQLRMEPGWHTYWRNPGQEGGFPTTVTWDLPAGVKAGDIQWPVPVK